MLQAFIVTLREGVEAALIIGITLAYLGKIGRPGLRRLVYWALVAAMAASIAGAILLSRTGLSQDVVEGWVMLLAAAFVISMVVLMMRVARRLKGEIESRVEMLAGRGSHAGLFLFVFLMVLREGIETVLVLAGVSLNSSDLMSFLGTLLGVGVAFAFGVMFVKGSVRVNLPKFFRVTTVILFFVAAQLIISGLHELSETGALPSSRREMALIGPIVRNDMFFFVTILALAALMVLMEWRRRAPLPEAGASRAESRMQEWSQRRERLWMAAVYASSFLFIVLVTAEFIYTRSASALTKPVELSFTEGKIRIPLAEVSDGALHRYQVRIGNASVRFLLVQKPDGNVATVADACQICGSAGFSRGSMGLVCRNCASPINSMALGQPGGCNPLPLRAIVANGSVTLTETDIASVAPHFEE